jgi:hypothetical protein
MTDKIKNKAVATKNSTVRKWKNFSRLVEAISLLAVSAFSLYGALDLVRNEWFALPLAFAAVVIGIRGALEFLKHLDREV